jgi:hypothetical protein
MPQFLRGHAARAEWFPHHGQHLCRVNHGSYVTHPRLLSIHHKHDKCIVARRHGRATEARPWQICHVMQAPCMHARSSTHSLDRLDTARLQRRCLHVYASDGGHFRSPRSEHITCDDTLLRDTAWASHHAMHTAPNTQPCTHSNTLPSLMSTMRQSDTRTPDTTSILHGTTQATQRFWCAHHGRCPNPTLALLTQLPHG